MATLDTILDLLYDLDGIGQTFNLDSHKFITTRKGVIKMIVLEGHTDGFNMEMPVGIEEGDMMDPNEIVARVQHRDEPDYDFATDPEWHSELQEDEGEAT